MFVFFCHFSNVTIPVGWYTAISVGNHAGLAIASYYNATTGTMGVAHYRYNKERYRIVFKEH